MKLIFLNGPPRSGKDTAGAIIAAAVTGARCDKFSRILKERTHAAYGLIGREGFPMRHDAFEDCKDEPRADFYGSTPRRAYIALSEKYYKPLHGPDIFGRLLANDLTYCSATMVVITDSGFRPEAEAMLRAFGAENARLIRLHRVGCSFYDSRSYIALGDLGVVSHDVMNFGSTESLREKLRLSVPEMRSPVSDQA